jgi:ADP-heptose:LPS heptosyltransferase
VDRFAAVAQHLHAAGHHVVVTGVAAERSLAQTVAQLAGLPGDRVLAGRLGLEAMASLVAAARQVVCGDTGVGHLATAYHTPSVILFGPVSPALWGPPAGRPQHRVLWHADRATLPLPAYGPHPALMAIGVPEVLTAVEDIDRRAVKLRRSQR